MEKQKKHGALAMITGSLGFLVRAVLALILIFIALSGFFRVRGIEVVGNTIYTAEQVAKESGIENGELLAKVLLENVGARLRNRLPAIDQTRVRISFPDRIVLEINEGNALLAAETENGYVYLTADGKVLSDFQVKDGLIIVKGLHILEAEDGNTVILGEEDSGKLKYLAELLTMLEERGILNKIREIDISNVAALKMNFDGRLTVRFGGPDLLSEKLRFFEEILGKLNNGEEGTLDLTKESEGHFIPG